MLEAEVRVQLSFGLALAVVVFGAAGCSSGTLQPPGGSGMLGGSGATTGGGGGASGAPGGGAAGASADGGGFAPVPRVHANPDGQCSTGIRGLGVLPADFGPATVVGTGTPASCTFRALQTAVVGGGNVSFDCGSAPVTIPVTATIELPIDKHTVIDGGNLITLDGGGAVRIMRFDSPNWMTTDYGLTLRHIALVNGRATPIEAIPTAPAPCSQGWNDGEGGAIYVRDGYLTVFDVLFSGNQAAPLGPDTGGGAIYVTGSKRGVTIATSTFTNNRASNAGAVGCLFAELSIYDSVFANNRATGHDANDSDASKCAAINNGQNEIGSGGNGGAIYSDGNSVNVTLCGDKIVDNSAGESAFGGGLFFTSNNRQGVLSIGDSTITGNTGGHWTNVDTGSVSDAGTAVGTNARSITITNSTIQGVP